MAINTGTLSLTRPRDPQRLYAAKFWQYNVGLLLAVTGAMLLMGFFMLHIMFGIIVGAVYSAFA